MDDRLDEAEFSDTFMSDMENLVDLSDELNLFSTEQSNRPGGSVSPSLFSTASSDRFTGAGTQGIFGADLSSRGNNPAHSVIPPAYIDTDFTSPICEEAFSSPSRSRLHSLPFRRPQMNTNPVPASGTQPLNQIAVVNQQPVSGVNPISNVALNQQQAVPGVSQQQIRGALANQQPVSQSQIANVTLMNRQVGTGVTQHPVTQPQITNMAVNPQSVTGINQPQITRVAISQSNVAVNQPQITNVGISHQPVTCINPAQIVNPTQIQVSGNLSHSPRLQSPSMNTQQQPGPTAAVSGLQLTTGQAMLTQAQSQPTLNFPGLYAGNGSAIINMSQSAVATGIINQPVQVLSAPYQHIISSSLAPNTVLMPLQQTSGASVRALSGPRPHAASSNNTAVNVNKHIQPKPAVGTATNASTTQAINLSTTNLLRQVPSIPQNQPRAKTAPNLTVRPTVTNVTSNVSIGQQQIISTRPITTLTVPKVVTMATLQQQQQILKQQQIQQQIQQQTNVAKQGIQRLQQTTPAQILGQQQVILQQPQLAQQMIRLQQAGQGGVQQQIILHSAQLLQHGHPRLAGQQVQPTQQQKALQPPQLIRLQHAIPGQVTSNQPLAAVSLHVPGQPVTQVSSSQPVSAVIPLQCQVANNPQQQSVQSSMGAQQQKVAVIQQHQQHAVVQHQHQQQPAGLTQQQTAALMQPQQQQQLLHQQQHAMLQQAATMIQQQQQQQAHVLPQMTAHSANLQQPIRPKSPAKSPHVHSPSVHSPGVQILSPGVQIHSQGVQIHSQGVQIHSQGAQVHSTAVRPVQPKSPSRPVQPKSPVRHQKAATPVKTEIPKTETVRTQHESSSISSSNASVNNTDSERKLSEQTVTAGNKPDGHMSAFDDNTARNLSKDMTLKSVDLKAGTNEGMKDVIGDVTDNSHMISSMQTDHSTIEETVQPYSGETQGVTTGEEEPDFIWEEYLEATGTTAVPPTAFKHVEISLQSGFTKGMKLEVPNKASVNSYWVASVVMICGPLLRLRYEGYEDDSSADFWCDISSSDIHPIGWCGQNGKSLHPPEAIKTKFSNWTEFLAKVLSGARTAPAYLLDRTTGSAPVDQIKQGMKLEVRDELEPYRVWFGKVLENVGGRLLLRYEGAEDAANDFWLFYLDERVHPVGWGKEKNCCYKPPSNIEIKHSESEWQTVLADAEKFHPPAEIFKDQDEIIEHCFLAGWHLEMLHPNDHTHICPATITSVIDIYYFIVEIDSLVENEEKLQRCCHSNSHGLFPVNWSSSKGIKLTTPNGWDSPAFEWNTYIQQVGGEAAPEDNFTRVLCENEFNPGMKLEAVNPAMPHQICVATITKIVDSLMWLHLDCSPRMLASHIVDVESQQVFPVGWCESNVYPLKPPRKSFKNKKVAVVQPEQTLTPDDFRSATYTQIKVGDEGRSKSWCPKIYFNHKCFSGPYLSKGRIAELPKCVGPGPVTLVMKEVLSMLINVAYKSSRVLREIQLESRPSGHMHQQTLKAKYKGKSYRAVVEIIKDSDQIDEFCRQICMKLECCPNLFSKNFVNGNCPENCSQLTKTKYTYYYGKKKKRKIGRPPGGHTNLENGPRKPGKRRKRRKVNLIHRKKRTFMDSDGDAEGHQDEVFDGEETRSETTSTSSKAEFKDPTEEKRPFKGFKPPRKKRKYTHHIPPPTDIKTRGAKLPKYSFERKTHKKILISDSGVKSSRLKNASHITRSYSAVSEVEHVDKPPVETPKRDILKLDSNPLEWSIARVVEFIKTTDCANLSRIFREQEIDGQALLLLSLPTVQEHMELKLGPAIKLCHHIERVKVAFFEQFAN